MSDKDKMNIQDILNQEKEKSRLHKMSEASIGRRLEMKSRMEDPDYVQRVAEGNRKKAKDPTWQKKMDAILKDRHNDPNWLEKMKELGQQKKDDPAFQKKMDKILKERAKDPNWRKKTKKASQQRSKKKSWKEANKRANRDPSKIEHQKQFVTGRNSVKYKGDYIGTCIETGKEVRAIGAKGLKELGFSPGMVSECCNGKRNSAKGYRWRREKV